MRMRVIVRLFLAIVILLLSMVGTGAGPSPLGLAQAQGTESRFFPETKQNVKGWFWKYWQEQGGLAQQGYPISGEIQERSEINGKTYLVQYFERAVFELHTENQPPYNVLLSLVGVTRYKEKYPAGAPNQKANSDPGTALFPQTGKKVGGAFLAYWKAAGSVAQQGYPISDEFQEKSDLDGKTYTVQYFERAVFEFHPENKPPYNVLLSQLGTFRYKAKYAQAGGPPPVPPAPPPAPAPFPTASGPLRDWITPVNVSNNPMYDNNPSIAASPINGGMTIGWEQRDDPTDSNFIRVSSINSPADPFSSIKLRSTVFKGSGGVKVRHDSLGRRHVIWWEQPANVVCDYYARIEVDGSVSPVETVPNTCGRGLKSTALAIGPDNSVHMLFGENNVNVLYYQRVENGTWTAQGEGIVSSGAPTSVALEVGTQGAVMAAYKAAGPGGNTDVYSAHRKGPNSWEVQNVSSDCCDGCPGNTRTYLPALAADPSGSGGIRMSWSDEQCDPRADPRLTDLYYREWLPDRGWFSGPARIVRDTGETYTSAMVVDMSGTAHIVYESDSYVGRRGNYRISYISGSGSTFSAPTVPFADWGVGSGWQKAPTIDYSRGWLHIAFNTDRDGNKEVYYSNKQVGR